MNTPTQRRATRLVCTMTVLIGVVTFALALVASVRDHMNEATNFGILGLALIAFGGVVLSEVNRAAKR